MTEKGYVVVKFFLFHYPHLVDAVVASHDKGIADDYFDEIAELCHSKNVRFLDRNDDYVIRTDYAIAVSWRWLIHADAARVIVFHDSMLPRYRGFNPLVTALINGDAEIGVTALWATTEYDRGDIIAQSSSAISYPIKIKEAIETLLGNYEALAATVGACLNGSDELPSTPQDDATASYSLWRDEEDYFVDWTHSAAYIKRCIDALGYPYKGAASMIDGKIVRIRDAEVLRDVQIANRTTGKVIFLEDAKPVVVCGRGLLKVTEVVDDETGASLLPLSRFRIRFKGSAEHSTPANVTEYP
jgi:methionyl-tRNA formyltransferase